jgi:DNA-3-methyladenine glycosylase I
MSDSGILIDREGTARCSWAGSDPLYVSYHDNEWGFPVHEDTRLFEKLCLEGFQAGLAWITILRKRENFRAAFAGFDIRTVAAFGTDDIERLLGDAGIVRHRGKIESTISNAARALELIEEFGSLSDYVWEYADQPPRQSCRPRSVETSRSAAGRSSGRPPLTPSCRPWDWSTIISPAARLGRPLRRPNPNPDRFGATFRPQRVGKLR